MAIEFTKAGVDVGIVTANPEAMLAFYRDTLGFEQEPDTPFHGGGFMHRLWCRDSLIKIVAPDPAPTQKPAAGGLTGALGYRYWTISVADIAAATAACDSAGYRVRVPVTEVRPGIHISMIEDPDGNWVELLQNDN